MSTVPCAQHPSAGRYQPSNSCKECARIYRRKRYREIERTTADRYVCLKWSAINRKIPFSLSLECFTRITEKPCVYAPENTNEEIYSGVDRIDSVGGYTEDNVCACCWRHNVMKSHILTHQQALEVAIRYQIPCGNKPTNPRVAR